MIESKESAQLAISSVKPHTLEGESKFSAFKLLIMNFLGCNADSMKLDKKFKKTIRVCVKDVLPQFVLTDGHFNLSGYITKEAYD